MDSNVNPNRNEKSEEEKTPQDYLRQIKENYPDLKQNLAMNVFVRFLSCVLPPLILEAR